MFMTLVALKIIFRLFYTWMPVLVRLLLLFIFLLVNVRDAVCGRLLPCSLGHKRPGSSLLRANKVVAIVFGKSDNFTSEPVSL